MSTEYDDGTISIDLEARDALYSELVEELPEEAVQAELKKAVHDTVSQMYDERDQIAQKLQQMQQQ